MKILKTLLIISLAFTFSACNDDDPPVFFSIENDIELGQQVSAEIEANPDEYPLLDETEYPEAYTYIRNMTDQILASEDVEYKEEFAWEVHIIHDDEVLNAFATPGGYLYVYTGLIKYLDRADDLAGVMGHEIAHSDRRHSMRQLQRVYGIQLVLNVLLGQNPSQLAEIVAGLAGNIALLSFSRDQEAEADEYSVIYLAQTEYACNGAYSFFQKLIDNEQAGGAPQFLSTHPDPASRVEEINEKADELGCDTSPKTPSSYQEFIDSLPE